MHQLIIPPRFAWLVGELRKLSQRLKRESGLVINTSTMACIILAKQLGKTVDPADIPKPPKKKRHHPVNNISVCFPAEDEWLLTAVHKLVEYKKKTGISPDTNLSKEFIRLASNGYKRELVGAELDRIIIDAFTEADEE